MEGYRTVRSSIILVAVDGRLKVYGSLDEIPEELRGRLLESTSGEDAATILIADRKGRDAILESLRKKSQPTSGPQPPVAARRRLPGSPRTWGAILVPGLIGLAVWLLATYR